MTPPSPERFGPYRIRRHLGEGGMGAVYVAAHETSGAEVAVKTVTADWVDERFLREGALIARLDHPHIVRVHAADLKARPPYFVQDLLPGPDLAQRLAEGPLPIAEAVAHTIALARAVQHAHERGVLHRDLKPENVVFDDRGRPVIIDFGLARGVGEAERLTATGEVLGTPHLMAPEQAHGEKADGPAVDVYGLGGLLYAMLTGRPPIPPRGSLIATLRAVIEDAPAPPQTVRAEVPPAIERECLRALAKDPAQRHPSAAALADALEAPASGRRSPLPAALLTALLLLAAGAFVALQRPAGPASTEPDVEAALRDRLAKTLRARAPLHREAVAGLIGDWSAAALPPDDGLRALTGLRLLKLGSVPAAREQAAALEAPGEPPGCALRGALSALDGDPKQALTDLSVARGARVRRYDLLAWEARALRRGGLDPERAADVLSRLDTAERHDAAVPGAWEDRAWALLALGRTVEAAAIALAKSREPPLLLALIGRLEATDLKTANALATRLLPERTAARAALAETTLARLKPDFSINDALPRVRLARQLDPGFRPSRALEQGLVAAMTQLGRLDEPTVRGLVELTELMPDSYPVVNVVFGVWSRLRGGDGQELSLRRILRPVARRLLVLAARDPRKNARVHVVVSYLIQSHYEEEAVRVARAELRRPERARDTELWRLLGKALHQQAYALPLSAEGPKRAKYRESERVLAHLHSLLPEGSPAQLDNAYMWGCLLYELGDPAAARPLLRSFLRRAAVNRTTYLAQSRALGPGRYLFRAAIEANPPDLALAEEVVGHVRRWWPTLGEWRVRAAWCAARRGRGELAHAEREAALEAFGTPTTAPLRAWVQKLRHLQPTDGAAWTRHVAQLGHFNTSTELDLYAKRAYERQPR